MPKFRSEDQHISARIDAGKVSIFGRTRQVKVRAHFGGFSVKTYHSTMSVVPLTPRFSQNEPQRDDLQFAKVPGPQQNTTRSSRHPSFNLKNVRS